MMHTPTSFDFVGLTPVTTLPPSSINWTASEGANFYKLVNASDKNCERGAVSYESEENHKDIAQLVDGILLCLLVSRRFCG